MYLNENDEAMLVATLLSALEPPEDRYIADRIISDLIELGHCDMDSGPRTYVKWLELEDTDDEDRVSVLFETYLGEEDDDEKVA